MKTTVAVVYAAATAPTGKTSEVQNFVIREMAKFGHKVHVCKSVSEAQAAVKEIMEL